MTTVTLIATGKKRKAKSIDMNPSEPNPRPASTTVELSRAIDGKDAAAGVTRASKKRKHAESTIPEIEVDVSAPEPPSKKALRKAKKGRNTASSTSNHVRPVTDDSEPDSDRAAVEQPLRPATRSDHGIWIGNLPFTATKAELRKFLCSNSSITEEHITRINLPSPGEGAPATPAASGQRVKPQNKGFAYVDFSTKKALEEALGLSETLFTGRRVLIKRSDSFEGRPEKAKDEVEDGGAGIRNAKPPSRRIFVGNLGFETTEDDLRDHYGKCGEVGNIHVATFEDSGKCKGFAWVEFTEVEAAEVAVRGWIKIDGKTDGLDDDGDEDDAERLDRMGSKGRRLKSRKWWVNKLKGRPLRMEFAEDKAVRYKKRFGKDAPGKIGLGGGDDLEGDGGGAEDGQAGMVKSAPKSAGRERSDPARGRKVDARNIKPGAALANAPRLTGAIVESTGQKTTFE